MLDHRFDDTFTSVDPSQIIKTSRELDHDASVKYEEVGPLSLDGKVLE